MTPPLRRWERLFLVALTIVSSATRAVFLLEIHDNPFFNNPTSDAYYYDAQAQSIADGDVLGRDVFFRAPGYPYWLGLIYALFGHTYLAVRIIQHALGVVVLVLLYLLCRKLFGPAVGVTACLLALFYPVLMYFEGQLLFDGFLTFLCLLWVFLAYHGARVKEELWWFLLSALFGIICVTRPTFLALAVPLFGYQLWRSLKTAGMRRALRLGGAIAAGIAITILPVTLRNYIVGKDPVLIASQGGINFFIGNNPAADGYTARIPTDIGASWEISEMTFYVEKQLGYYPTPSEESDFWYGKGLQFILHQPVAFLTLLAKKVYLFWNALEIPNNLDFYTFSRYSLLLRVMPIGFWCVGPLGLLGMMLASKAHRGRRVAAFVVMYCGVTALFFVCDRYRLPVVPLLCAFAGYAVVTLYQWLRGGEYRSVLVCAIPLVVLTLLVNSNAYQIPKEEPVHQFYMLGLIDQQNGNCARAVSYFEKASAYGQPMRNLYLHWGECELTLGHSGRAKEKFHQELTYHPSSYGALADLSALFLDERMLDSVVIYATKAISVKPFMASAYVSLGQAYSLAHNLARAESVLTVGSQHCGPNFRYGNYLLAGVYLERGDVRKAEEEYRAILRPPSGTIEPEYEAGYLMPEDQKTGIDEKSLRAKTLYGLGHVFVSRRELDSAIACFRSAIHESPVLADAWADLGVGLLRKRQLVEADSAMRESLRLQSDNFMYWYNYGSLLATMNRSTEARQAFERVLSLRPDFLPAQKDLAYLVHAGVK